MQYERNKSYFNDSDKIDLRAQFAMNLDNDTPNKFAATNYLRI